MQLISNLSKSFVLVLLLGCSILLTLVNVTFQATGFGYLEPIATSITSVTKRTVWDSIRNDFALDHQVQSARVQAEIRRLVADPDRFYSILKAAGPYMYFIYKETHAHGLPTELALIPFIESEFNPNDHSNKGATGLWQLMPQTAKDLGVKVKSGYDGRRNVVASTDAALTYFNDLANNFNGNWYLAIAAYNCGPGCVQSAARRTGTENFWQLPVPKETKYYVPRLLAVAEIIENPKKYGMQLPPIDNAPYFKEVPISKSTSLEKVSQNTGVNLKTLVKLNPDTKRGVMPIKNGVATLLMPVKKTSDVEEKSAPAHDVIKTVPHKITVAAHKSVRHSIHKKPARHKKVAVNRHNKSRRHHRGSSLFPTATALNNIH